jgi:hypothetical protein
MQARTCRRLIAAVTVAAATVSAPAHAGIWKPVPTGVSQTITSIEYRGGDNLWFTTSNAIYKKGSFTPQLNRPGTNFNAIAFSPNRTIGIAVGDAGVFYRFNGSSWSLQPQLKTYKHAWDGCPSSPSTPVQADSAVVHDLTHVRWVDHDTVFILSERPGSLMRSDDAGQTWREINRRPDLTCRIPGVVKDVYVLPDNQQHMLFIGDGSLYHSSNGLTSTAAYRGGACGDRLRVNDDDPARMYVGGMGCYRFGYSEDGGVHSAGPSMMNGSNWISSHAFDSFGSTAIGVGNAGYVFNSITPTEAYLQPAGGQLATNDWRAVDLASASEGAVGGANGGLMVSDKLNTVPDIFRPTGKITGPTSAVAGETVTFTADVSDAASGIDPAGFSWSRDGEAVGGGQTIAMTFPRSGWYAIEVSFRDRAGNTERATGYIDVDSPPTDTTDPTGTITGPEFAVAGQAATFTINATDDAGGSGIDASSFSWSRDFSNAGRGNSVTMTFPSPGADTVSVSFADLAGNRNSVSVIVPVAPKPEDRPKPVTVNTPAPVVKKKGGRYVIPIKGGYRLPPSVQAKLGCKGDIVFTMKKGKRLVSARTTKLKSTCRYSKSFSVAKSKLGSTKKVGITVRFSGNAFLAPVKRTYQVKVPRG